MSLLSHSLLVSRGLQYEYFAGISGTGSCLHKEVNYDTNNNAGVPQRDVGVGEGRGAEMLDGSRQVKCS